MCVESKAGDVVSPVGMLPFKSAAPMAWSHLTPFAAVAGVAAPTPAAGFMAAVPLLASPLENVNPESPPPPPGAPAHVLRTANRLWHMLFWSPVTPLKPSLHGPHVWCLSRQESRLSAVQLGAPVQSTAAATRLNFAAQR